MKIRRLDIHGFKSFAERTVLTFGEGITGVVGPNGCGKSNIVDAIRWVMGEQSAKHLRGGGMQDVIFAGSESRGPQGMAEVTITFKNDGALVPPEYQRFEEIGVTRRLFRDGTSEYEINRTKVRLKDVFDLFMGTGIGKQAYSIIEQGRIGLIVTAKPEDRRAFIEEAAGISRYKARRKQAERRIEATEQNLLRITDITNELEQRIHSLERQAKKAERYKRLKGELKELELHSAAHRYFELVALERYEETTVDGVKEQIARTQGSLETEEQRVEEALGALAVREQELRLSEERIREQQQQLLLAEQNIEHMDHRRAQKLERQSEASHELATLEAERVTLKADREALLALGQELEDADSAETVALRSEEENLQRLEAAIKVAERALEEDKEAMVQTLTTIAKHNNNLLNLDRVKGELELRLGRAENADQLTIDRLKELEKEAKDSLKKLHENRQLRLALADRKSAQEGLQERLAAELTEADGQLLALRQDLMDKRSRLNSLTKITKNYEGCKDGVRSIMRLKEENPEAAPVLHGLVADFVSAEPRFESAVEAVLGDRLQYVVVERQQDGVASVEYLKRTADGRSTFIPLDLREDHVSWAPRLAALRAKGAHGRQVELPLSVSVEAGSAPPEVSYESSPGEEARAPSEPPAPFSAEPATGPTPEDDRIVSAPPFTHALASMEEDLSSMALVASAPSLVPTAPSLAPASSPPTADLALALPESGASLLPVPESADEAEELWPDLSASGVCGKLLDLVSTQPGYEQVARVLLGDVVVVEELAVAQRLWRENGHRKTLVTLDGEVLDPVGVLTGGASEHVATGLLSQKREIKELTDQVHQLEAKVRVVEQRHASLKQRLGEIDGAIKDLHKEGHEEELSIVSLERDLRRLEESIKSKGDERRTHEEEIALVAQKLEGLAREDAHTRELLSALEAERAEQERALAESAVQTNQLKEAQKVQSERVTALKVAVAANNERRDGSAKNLARILQRLADVEQRITKLRELIEECGRDADEQVSAIERTRAEIEALAAVVEAARVEVAARREEVEASAKELKAEEARLRAERKEGDGLRSALAEAQMRLRELQLGRDSLVAQIEERYRVSLLEALTDFHLVAPQSEEHLSRIEKLRHQLDGIGPINLTAIEEFAEVSERHQYLAGQKEDLEHAIASLRAAIKRINRTSKDRYVEAFRLVNEKFQQVFPRLFNGGTASLVMLDENDPLESGIEMLAQPPGKKLQSVTLLSGGEKALTAVSLIFAIFLIKPTPFCLLDEVDAPLDEANVGRYNEMLRDMSSVSQFILITHNKRTMELPDRLYGVTMEEPGISKIVPVDVSNDEKRRRLRAV